MCSMLAYGLSMVHHCITDNCYMLSNGTQHMNWISDAIHTTSSIVGFLAQPQRQNRSDNKESGIRERTMPLDALDVLVMMNAIREVWMSILPPSCCSSFFLGRRWTFGLRAKGRKTAATQSCMQKVMVNYPTSPTFFLSDALGVLFAVCIVVAESITILQCRLNQWTDDR